MQTHLPNTQLALVDSVSTVSTESESDLQKAWHLLSLLLSLGRPASPFDLAFRCTLFRATPDFIRSLCSIPYSPITLTTSDNNGRLVTISPRGLLSFQQFVSNFNLIDAFMTQIRLPVRAPGIPLEDVVRVSFRKRKRIQADFGEVDKKHLSVSPFSKRIRNDCPEVHFHMNEGVSRSIIQLNNMIFPPSLLIKTTGNELMYNLSSGKQIENELNKSMIAERKEHKTIMAPEAEKESAHLRTILDNDDACQDANVDQEDLKSRMDIDATLCKEGSEQTCILPVLCASSNDACNADCYVQTVGIKSWEKEPLVGSGTSKEEAENISQPINFTLLGMPRKSDCKRTNEQTSLNKEQVTNQAKNQAISPSNGHFVVQKQFKPSAKMKLTFGDAISPRQQTTDHTLEGSKAVSTQKGNRQIKRNIMTIGMPEKPKQKHDSMQIKEGRINLAPVSPTDQVETKGLPYFDSYIVEEEEGSGGYGTVYRARRKSDGTTVAIKCPHANAHRHHVSNELRMLERFGGKNFVIKYEGCFKSGNSDCFVLEHVEHDRPEMLKREIDIFKLRWYGYCMFRALASLHKQGVVHRDVKPGNFLFSQKANKGYLIDFNLAMDLRLKYGTTNKSKARNDVSFNHVTLPNTKSLPPTKNRKFLGAKSFDAVNQEATKGLKATLEVKNQRKKAVDRTKAQNELSGWNIMKSQGPDGSGITSVKDPTSTRTPSAERLREPLPCHGRKELISLLHEAMQSSNYEASSVPASMRKRIAAPHGKVDERRIYITPMPLHSMGTAIPDGMHKKEGPCVGTKGFRAPEVLFRSPHQGPKVDIWSAGVTLLYLMIGRTPFYGDPEQNIKDIAKLRGGEDLWEVAKLHDRESALPSELYKTEFLPSVALSEWCKINTKRRDFLDLIPTSLLDLVDKCLTVNPRLRISAEDALKHEFFGPCREVLRKQRLLRQELSLDSGTS